MSRRENKHGKARPGARGQLIADRRGISTMEYAVIFIVILIGGLALWKNLSKSLAGEVSTGNATFDATLGAAQKAATSGDAPSAVSAAGVPVAQPASGQPSGPAPSAAADPATSATPGPGTKKQNSL
jgi:hypothetical protein